MTDIRKLYRRFARSLLSFEEKIFGEPTPTDWVLLDYVSVAEKLISAFPRAKLYLSDNDYYTCPKETIATFLSEDPTNLEQYTSELFDCDDFSFRLMGQFHVKPYASLAFGIAWSEVHAYNVFIDSTGQVYLVEPQTDQILLPSNDISYDTALIII
jgi:hypothetical protein